MLVADATNKRVVLFDFCQHIHAREGGEGLAEKLLEMVLVGGTLD